MPLTKDGYWIPPKLWKGATAYLIGGGPSLLSMDLSLVQDKRVIGCNDAFLLGDWVDAMVFGDYSWYQVYKWEVNRFQGIKMSLHECTKDKKGWKTFKRKTPGIQTEPGLCGWCKNVGFAALNIAILFGCERVVLLGYDMKFGKLNPTGKGFPDNLKWSPSEADLQDVGEVSNWHPNIKQIPSDRHATYAQAFKNAAPKIEELGVEVVNATPDSALTCFPHKPLEDVV